MTIEKIKSIFADGAVSAGLLAISLVEIDLWLRLTTVVIGTAVGILSMIRVIRLLRTSGIEQKIKKLELKKKEEEVRRYFETKYSSK